MSNIDIIRAWRDEEYRDGLNNKELAALPENPAGALELSDGELNAVNGGLIPCTILTIICNHTQYPCQGSVWALCYSFDATICPLG